MTSPGGKGLHARGDSATRRAIALSVCYLAAVSVSMAMNAGTAAQTFASDYVARWSLDNGRYLVEQGQYLEAMEALDTALEMAENDATRSEALLQKGSVLSVFLDSPEEAVRAYDTVLKLYPNSPEAAPALFQAGKVLFDNGDYRRATFYFERYIELFPTGASAATAEFLLQQSKARPGELSPAPTEAPPINVVRVSVAKGLRSASIEGELPLMLEPRIPAGKVVVLRAEAGRVRWSEDGQAVSELSVSADGPVRLRTGRFSRSYRGRLVVSAKGDELNVVNHVDVEEYLYGVVTQELFANWPAEALKVQAIASRSYALYQAGHRQSLAYDMVANEGSQVYGGVDGESNEARQAVDATRGQVMAYHGQPILAMFSANAGWHTADPAYIFKMAVPYLTAVPDPYSPNEQMGRWTRSYSEEEVRQRLSARLGKPLGRILALRPTQRCPSGRIVRIEVVHEQGSYEMPTRPTVGRALELPEILLDIRRDRERFLFKGGGFGHGVGLSQWGAKAMADRGFKAPEILKFYYRGADLIRWRP